MSEKKNLATTYSPKDFEERIYKLWEEKKYFTPVVDKNKKPFSGFFANIFHIFIINNFLFSINFTFVLSCRLSWHKRLFRV